MSTVALKDISRLQKETSQLRNVCILAHIDHGKTTLSDSLIATNGIISSRLAGKIRYLDSRPDEQERGITMKSSAISLIHENHLIHLIDSPGHVDFSSEVATSLRLCDGAIVLVDVVEGICSQTHEVLRQAFLEGVRPCLVLNKLDRLVLELRETSLEAYERLKRIIEQANAIMASFSNYEKLGELNRCSTYEDDYFSPPKGNVIFSSAIDGWACSITSFAKFYAGKRNISEQHLKQTLWGEYFFDPETRKSSSDSSLARTHLWKPMFVQFIMDTIYRIYHAVILDRMDVRTENEPIEKITSALGIKVLPRDLVSKDRRSLLQKIFSQWMPLAQEVLQMVIYCLPSPIDASSLRVRHILSRSLCEHIDNDTKVQSTTDQNKKKLIEDIIACNTASDAITVVYISKMVAVPLDALPSHRRKVHYTAEEWKERHRLAKERRETPEILTEETPMTQIINPSNKLESTTVTNLASSSSEVFIAFARVFSGTIKAGQKLFLLKSNRDFRSEETHENPDDDVSSSFSEVTIGQVFFWMGREVETMEEISAGNIVGIGGLDLHVYKRATLTTIPWKEESIFKDLRFHGAPILRVAIEPTDPRQVSQLLDGLRLLHQSDPAVEILTQETGERVIVTAGELHLERCLKDLRERFANISIISSSPIVPFREGIALRSNLPSEILNIPSFSIEKTSRDGICSIRVSARPLPWSIAEFIERHASTLKSINRRKYLEDYWFSSLLDNFNRKINLNDKEPVDRLNQSREIVEFRAMTQLKSLFEKNDSFWASKFPFIYSFGPRRIGPNILFLSLTSEEEIQKETDHTSTSGRDEVSDSHPTRSNSFSRYLSSSVKEILPHLITGFQLATQSGPLCEEPMMGVGFFLEKITIKLPEAPMMTEEISLQKLSGQLMHLMKEACHEAFLEQSPRMILSMYSCTVQATTPEALGKVYTVLSQRHARILAEHAHGEDGQHTKLDQRIISDGFLVEARIPVVESLGFSEDIRKKTSGSAHPQLLFCGWEILDEDPFWVPRTKEELEDLGERADKANLALTYLNMVRKRKGLRVEEKLVEHGEKQRTRMKK